jgi:hypothetical protein
MTVTTSVRDPIQSKIAALYLGAEVEERVWFPIGKLVWHDGKYHAGCVGGVKSLIAAAPLWRHYYKPETIGLIKTTHEIPADYACRMPLDRPQEMRWYLPSLGLPSELDDPLGHPDGTAIAFVARSGGYRETDSLDIFPEVLPDPDGCYRFYFLLRKLSSVAETAIDLVVKGDSIDIRDWWAIHQPTGHQVGKVPGYIRALVKSHPHQVKVEVQQVNRHELPQVKLLCSITCDGFIPFSTGEYLPLGNLK